MDRMDTMTAAASMHVCEAVIRRGRNAGCPAPPAQIRTSGIPAYGSYLGCITSKRTASCCLAYTQQSTRPTGPALRPG